MADTIIIETPVATVLEVSGKQGPQGVPGATGATGATGPQGPAGTGIETLTTAGDLLYRDNSAAARLPIGSSSQILKVVNGLPAWANESGAVTSVNGQTGAVTVAAAQHAVEHEAGEADEIQAMAVLVDTDYLPLNGVYFHDGTLTSGRPNFFKTGTRKNTKLQWNNSTSEWELIRNLTLEAVGWGGTTTFPWTVNNWADGRDPAVVETIAVTRLGLEDMTQKLAETGSAATATTSQDGLISASDQQKLNGISAGAEVNVQANWTEADSNSDAFILNKPSTFAPSSHAAAHASSGSDPLFDQDLNTTDTPTFAGLTATSWQSATGQVVVSFDDNEFKVTSEDELAVKVVAGQLQLRDFTNNAFGIFAANNNLTDNRTYDLPDRSGELMIVGDAPASHTHAASDVTSGTLTHERGGLEADVSAYNGLVKISGGSTSAVTTTATGESVIGAADAAAARSAISAAAASHTHPSTDITGLGTLATANAATPPNLGTTTPAQGFFTNLSATAELQLPTNAPASPSAGDLYRVSDTLRYRDSANTERLLLNATDNLANLASASTARTNLGLGGAATLSVGTTSGTVAAGNHSHELTALAATGATNGHVLTANGSGGVTFAAASGGLTGIASSASQVLATSSGNITGVDGNTIDSADPFIKWNDTAARLEYANPLSRPSGAFYVGVAPTTTALGTRAINIQADRSLAATRVATGTDAVMIGNNGESTNTASTAVGFRARATGLYSVAMGGESVASGNNAVAIGEAVNATAQSAIALGGYTAGGDASAINAVALNQNANLRGQFSTRPFQAVYWGGQTTSDTANVELNLDATATNRMTIAANTAVIADIYVIARRTDNTKFLAARRWVAIRRDGSNNTALIGAVQTIGTDQSEGSPTWTFTIDADDTASVESLRVRVTGAASETVNWRVCAIYRVVA